MLSCVLDDRAPVIDHYNYYTNTLVRNDTDKNSTQQGGREFDEPSDEIIALYCKHIPEYLSDLQTAVRENDEEAVSFQCHKMVSAVKSMGFDNIARLLETIQKEKPEGEQLVVLCGQVEMLIKHTLLLLNK